MWVAASELASCIIIASRLALELASSRAPVAASRGAVLASLTE